MCSDFVVVVDVCRLAEEEFIVLVEEKLGAVDVLISENQLDTALQVNILFV